MSFESSANRRHVLQRLHLTAAASAALSATASLFLHFDAQHTLCSSRRSHLDKLLFKTAKAWHGLRGAITQ